MRKPVLFFLLTALGCERPSAPTDVDDWNSYPQSSVLVSGPIPIMAAFLAPVDDVPGYLRSVLVVTNPASVPVTFRYGTCDFGLRLYQNATFSGAPIWDNRGAGCDLIALSLAVPAGETRVEPVFGFVNPLALSDSLPPGLYHAAVTWRSSPNGRVRIVPAGEVRIAPSQWF